MSTHTANATSVLFVLIVAPLVFVRCTSFDASTAPVAPKQPRHIVLDTSPHSTVQARLVVLDPVSGEEASKVVPGDTLIVSCPGFEVGDSMAAPQLSVDSGESWGVPAVTPAAGTAQSWRVVVPWHLDAPRCLVRLVTETDTLRSAPFGIKALVAVRPRGGETYYPGDTLVVEWRAHATVQNVTARLLSVIEGSSRPGELEIMSEASTTVSMTTWPAVWPRYYWIIPDTVSCEVCWIEVEDYMEGDPRDPTGIFTIASADTHTSLGTGVRR